MKKKKLIKFLEKVEATTRDHNTGAKIRNFLTKHKIWPNPTLKLDE